jgi:hypothetical protein
VLNPGGEAVLEEATLYYARNPQPAQHRLIVGRPFVALPHVDYAFEEPPRSISVKGRNAQVVKTAVRRFDGPDVQAFAAASQSDREAALAFAEGRLRRRPDQDDLLKGYLDEAERREGPRVEAFLKSGLDRRPVLVAWHRAYQTAAERNGHDAALLALYDRALAAEPTNGALLYLRGRVEPDWDGQERLYRRAIEAAPRLGWPWLGLGLRAAAAASWADCLRDLRKARELKVDEDLLGQGLQIARLATGDAKSLVQEYRDRLARNALDLRTMMHLIEAMAATGPPEPVERELAAWENPLPAEVRGAFVGPVRAVALYEIGKFADCEQLCGRLDLLRDSALRVQTLLAMRQAEQAAGNAAFAKTWDDGWSALAVSLALGLDGRAEESARWRERAISKLETAGSEPRQAARILGATAPVAGEDLSRLIIDPGAQAMMGLVLAQRFPARRAEYHAVAARFNFLRRPPITWSGARSTAPPRRRDDSTAIRRPGATDRGPVRPPAGGAGPVDDRLDCPGPGGLPRLGRAPVPARRGRVRRGRRPGVRHRPLAPGRRGPADRLRPGAGGPLPGRRPGPAGGPLAAARRGPGAAGDARLPAGRASGPAVRRRAHHPGLQRGIRELPRLGLLGWPRTVLELGLPLMSALTAPELRAVLAHELAHHSARHARSSSRIYRLHRTWGALFQRMQRPATGQLDRAIRGAASRFVDWYWPRLHARALVLSRAQEYHADRVAAGLVAAGGAGAATLASALWRMECLGPWLSERFWVDLFAGADSSPEPPADLMARMRAAYAIPPAPDDAARWVERGLSRATGHDETHPAFRDRVGALGLAADEFRAAGYPSAARPSAAEALLGADADAIECELAADWHRGATAGWRERHRRAAAEAKRRQPAAEGEGAAPARTPEDPRAAWEAARSAAELRGPAAAEPLLRAVLERVPGHAGASVVLGQHLLGLGHPEGARLLEQVIDRADESWMHRACQALQDHFRATGQVDRLREVRARLDRHDAMLAEARRERSAVRPQDSFGPHDLTDEQLGPLRRILLAQPDCGAAWLVRKELRHLPHRPLFVLCVRRKSARWWRPQPDRDRELVRRLAPMVELPGQTLVIARSDSFRELAEKVMSIPGAEVFRWDRGFALEETR